MFPHKSGNFAVLALSLFTAGNGFMLPASAAGPPPPDAGQILKTVPSAIPAPPASSGTSALPESTPERPPLKIDDRVQINVKRIVLTGNTLFTREMLLPLVQDAIGQALTLDALNVLAFRITQYYRDHGYLLARAYIPTQDITEGTLEIAVLEGRYGKIKLENHSRISDAVLEQMLSRLESGQPIEASPLERQLLLMSDLPGALIGSTLQPGTTTGTSDLTVRTDDAPALAGSAGIDNWGNRYTGALRAFVAADWANPLGLGDRLDLYGMGAERGGTQYGRVAYDLPISGSGTRIGAAYAHLAYALGLDFSSLQAHGTADITSLYLSQPLTRSRSANTTLQFNMDHRALRDYVDSTAGSDVKEIDAISAGLNGDRRDALGVGTWTTTLTSGRLKLDALTTAADLGAYHTAGDYLKFSGAGSQLVPLSGSWSLFGALSGQMASKNLDMSERFSMGGPTGVRAYPVGEVMANDALLGTLELRYTLNEQLQLTGFADAGVARLNRFQLVTDTRNQRNLSGAGVGASWTRNPGPAFNTYLAWRTGDPPTSAPDRHPTAWVQLIQAF
ncbi:MAG: ShlB/FhaC/HecB family hemolysin secretion/activation protein [Betaproteobacteria bacterium]|nr:ShlB/FhaC/HecB family hemolysin secretion/activation protein [Betaproteobacteria bacterium]